MANLHLIFKDIARYLRNKLWILNGYYGPQVNVVAPQKAIVLVTYYNVARMNQIEAQVRNILKCNFVEKVVISNHNPEVIIEKKVKFRDERIVFINQEVKRGCGYRWYVAQKFNPEYLIVIDDDILLFSWQLAKLFKHLVNEPSYIHGISGLIYSEEGEYEYISQREIKVDYLCEVYALTRTHLERFFDLREMVAIHESIAYLIDHVTDFMVISKTGRGKPQIHNIGRISRSSSFDEIGLAIHKASDFDHSLSLVYQALNRVD